MATARFIDRLRELAALETAWKSGRAELVLVAGRRRVGKSELLTRFGQGKRIAYVAAAQRLRADQLRDAERDIAAFANRFRVGRPPQIRLSRWEELLALMAQGAKERRVGVIIDEFSYLVEQAPELPSLIQRWWDREGSRTKLMLVLAGSDQSMMEELVSARAPLFGRATLRPRIEPLDYYQSARFVPRWSATDRVRAYAIAGGIPAYLRLFDDRTPLRANLVRLAFAPEGELFREAEYLLESEFREVSRRGSIFRAIAEGAVRPSEIATRIGLGSAADVQVNLRDLVRLGLLERVVPITQRDQLRPRQVIYRIADPYLRFFFTVLERRRAQIAIGPAARVSEELSVEELDLYVSRVFEQVARQYAWRAAAARRLPLPEDVGEWWDGTEEVDLVGVRGRSVLFAGEAKWTRGAVGLGELDTLRRRAAVLSTEQPRLLLISRSGFSPALQHAGGAELIGINDLFAPDLEYERR